MQCSDGCFYGATGGYTVYDNLTGAVFYAGDTVFKITTNGTLTTLYAFGEVTNSSGVQLDGASPDTGLVQGSDGCLYGTTEYGGTNNDGTVFKITTNGALTTLYSFAGGTDGANPATALVQGSDGNFYGAASGGGSYNNGTLFQITANGALTSLYSFTGGTDGASPRGVLVQGSDGNFYGTVSGGGQDGQGAVFRLTTEPEFQAPTLAKGALNLTWNTKVGASYQLQYNSDLSSTNWINMGGVLTATGATLSRTDSSTNAQRFYRVVLSQ
jgi:uncharacterized repeat protein (TIGR03803 family)